MPDFEILIFFFYFFVSSLDPDISIKIDLTQYIQIQTEWQQKHSLEFAPNVKVPDVNYFEFN